MRDHWLSNRVFQSFNDILYHSCREALGATDPLASPPNVTTGPTAPFSSPAMTSAGLPSPRPPA